jgi:cytochrome c peroxidase
MKNYILILVAIMFLILACKNKKTDKLAEARLKVFEEKIDENMSMFSKLGVADTVSSNIVTDAKVTLGQMLYFDTKLSKTGKNSCNSCHNLSTFGVDNSSFSKGDNGGLGGRNSPTVFNAALHSMQFWDGRAKDVEEQAGMPILNPVEMAMPSETELVKRLQADPNYQNLFKAAFPDISDPINFANLRLAIAAFERKLITPSRFDAYIEGDKSVLNEQEKRGWVTFVETGCTTCHNGALLGGNMFQKFGVFADYWTLTKSAKIDNGKFDVSKNEADKYIFKVPSLRNIDKTGPYFHDGSVKSLDEAIKIMAKLQLNNDLTTDQVADISAFLKSLTADIPEKYKKAPTVL